MSEVTPRFEYRIFGYEFISIEDRIRNLARPQGEAFDSDIYLVAKGEAADRISVKVRDGSLDIKERIEQCKKLELWKPTAREEFPVSAEFLGKLYKEMWRLSGESVIPDRCESLSEIVRDFVDPNPGTGVAIVEKHRSHFSLDSSLMEIAEVTVNGARLRSIAVEGEDADVVLNVADKLGFQGRENVDYSRMVRRVLGMEYYPEQPWYHDGTGN